jgi:hypothetical protein
MNFSAFYLLVTNIKIVARIANARQGGMGGWPVGHRSMKGRLGRAAGLVWQIGIDSRYCQFCSWVRGFSFFFFGHE